MRVVVVTPWVPGLERPRSLGFVQMLAEHHEVHLVSATWDDADSRQLRTLPVAGVTDVRLSRYSAALRAFVALVTSRRSLQQSYLGSRRLAAAVGAAVEAHDPDVVLFNVIRTAQLASRARGRRRVIDLDEFRSAYYAQLARTSTSPLWRLVGRLEAGRMAAAEERALATFDRVVVSSPVDLREDARTVSVIRSPHALGSDARWVEDAPGGGRPLVFIGRMSYSANVQAVEWFVEEVLGPLREELPDLRLDIVGADPTRAVLALADDRVRVLGRVEETGPHYAGALASIVPVTLATGVQMKLIESLSAGVPTISTPLCAAQAGVTGGVECLTADTAEAWQHAVRRMVTEPTLRADLSRRGRAWAVRTYGREEIARRLEAVLSDRPDD